MPFVTTADGTEIFYKDWGQGRPVVLSHGWPLDSDSWEKQQLALAEAGYRAIAHDRRGHGRSTQTWAGNDMDTYADDLAAVIEHLDLRDVTLVGFSTGGGEVTRYTARHGLERIAQLALVSAVTPFMLRTDDNPGGVPLEVFDGLRASSLADRAQLYRDLADGPFYGANRPGASVSQGVRDSFWAQGVLAGHKSTHDSIAAFSATDLRPDLARIAAAGLPTLIVHGDDDQVVPYEVGGRAAAALVPQARFLTYAGAPHGLGDTHAERLTADLLDFLKS